MSSDTVDRLNELAEEVAAEFPEHRPSEKFRDISPIVETSDRDRPTLIVHIDRENAAQLADEVGGFLEERGARTNREVHGPRDVRVLATVE